MIDLKGVQEVGLAVAVFGLLTMILRWLGVHAGRWINASIEAMDRQQEQLAKQTEAQMKTAAAQEKYAENARSQTEALGVLVELGKSSLEYEEISAQLHAKTDSHLATVATENALFHKATAAISHTQGMLEVLNDDALPPELRRIAGLLKPHFEANLRELELARDTLRNSKHVEG